MARGEGTASSSSCSHTPTLYAPFDRHWGRKAGGGGVETRMLSCCFGCCTDSSGTRTIPQSGAPSSVSGTPSCCCPSLANPALGGGGRAAHPPNATLAHVSSPPLDFTAPLPTVPDTQALSPVPSSLPRSVPTWRSLRTQACSHLPPTNSPPRLHFHSPHLLLL